MRRRRHEWGLWTLAAALVVSAAVHAVLYFPVSDALSTYLAPSAKQAGPVKMVRLSPEAYRRSMEAARQARSSRRPARPGRAATAEERARRPEVEAPESQPEQERRQPIDGQVVDVPATRDDSPNPDAEYLGRSNVHVEKESVARLEERDPSLKRRTNRLQRKSSSPNPESQKTLGLSVDGDRKSGADGGDEGEKAGPGRGEGEGEGEGQRQFVLEVPDLERRDDVKLELSDLPGVRQSVQNRSGTEALDGNGERFRFEPGQLDGTGRANDAGGGGGGGGESGGLPSLESLRPTLGTVARISGSPSSDYVEGVPEGDGTFLNTREFKYATFFIRVKDSVEGYWRDITQREYRRRDPTGRVYGSRDRATLLSIVLDRSGALDSVSVARSCGLDFLDQAAVQAIRQAQPFPNPPDGISESDGSIRFNFQFVVVMRSASPFDTFR